MLTFGERDDAVAHLAVELDAVAVRIHDHVVEVGSESE
jgi:hypothetical protein